MPSHFETEVFVNSPCHRVFIKKESGDGTGWTQLPTNHADSAHAFFVPPGIKAYVVVKDDYDLVGHQNLGHD
jgi:hypothetical protein